MNTCRARTGRTNPYFGYYCFNRASSANSRGTGCTAPIGKGQADWRTRCQSNQNRDTLQIGYGSIPNAIMDNLKDYRNLSIHTEMIPEKVIALYDSGAVTNENNPFKKGKMTATFAYGSQNLYDFLHENQDIYMLPVNKTNHVGRLQDADSLVTVNAGVEVDFLGQVNSEMVGGTYWSSTGGQSDFQVASRLSEGGRGVICLHSTAKGDSISKIVPALNPGTPVSTSKTMLIILPQSTASHGFAAKPFGNGRRH